MPAPDDTRSTRDVVVVGGGPAGITAGLFTARYGLDTLVFDRGRSSLQRIAHLENQPGFPAGIDIETFRELTHAQAERAGCAVVADQVTAVERDGGQPRFTVRTADGRRVDATRVVSASKYDSEYLAAFEGLFTTETYDGEPHEVLDASLLDGDGRSPIDGLYVAGRLAEAGSQVVCNAGHGAGVGLAVVEDHRLERGYPPELAAAYHDWVVVEGGYGGAGWAVELRERFDEALPADHGPSEAEVESLRADWVAEHRDWEISADEAARRREAGHRTLASHLDTDAVLDALPDDAIRAYAAELDADASPEVADD